jgi:hypothetical protein
MALLLSTTAFAEMKPYPDRWENEDKEKFQTLDELQDVYWKIYRDTNYEDELEILERMKWYEDVFTEEEIEIYRRLDVPKVSADKNYKFSDQIKTSDILQRYYIYEKELLRLENDINLRNWTETVFVNDSMDDSPFDIIEDLHRIEEELFGRKFKKQKFDAPLFIEYDPDQEHLLPELEDWQDGREKTMQDMLKSRGYAIRDNSFTGVLAGLKKYMDLLLMRPLISGKATEQFMESATNNEVSGDTYGAGVTDYDPPSPDDKTPPESETVLLERPWDDQSSTAKQELTTQSVLDRSSNINVGQMITNALRDTETKEGKLHRLLESQLKKWQDGMEFQEKTRYHETIQQRIAFWNQDLEAALEGFISLRRILEDFLKKPAL